MLIFYFNFFVFAFVASITPGPTNLISLMIGSKQGISAAIPFVVGASFSAALILWLSGFGLTSLFVNFPLLQTVMTWTGALWISWLGQAAKLINNFPKWERLINRSLAILLLSTVWLSVFMMR